MTGLSLARLAVPALLAAATAWYLDRSMGARRLLPPGFVASGLRRVAGAVVVGLLLWVGVFLPLGAIGTDVQPDVSKLTPPDLFLLHLLMLLTLGIWFLLGFAGVREARPAAALPAPPSDSAEGEERLPVEAPSIAGEGGAVVPVVAPALSRRFAQQLGLLAPSIPRELGLGLGLGFGAWAAVLAVMALIALALYLSGNTAAPKELPALVPWLAGQPLYLRVGLCLSAGFVEELFFRGFLQPRVGIVLSTALFALAHLSYGQPLMLVGITLLSLIYGLLVRWRQSIWAAVAAHSLFDGIQLLILVPLVIKLMRKG